MNKPTKKVKPVVHDAREEGAENWGEADKKEYNSKYTAQPDKNKSKYGIHNTKEI